MAPDNFKCQQCGRCCRNLRDAYAASATNEDIQRWRENYRHDILAWVELSPAQGGYGGHLWVDPESGEEAERCPWLRKMAGGERYSCAIDELKPSHCREYPLSRRHAESTGCRGWSE